MNISKRLLRHSLLGLLGAFFLILPSARGQQMITKRKVSHRVVPQYPALAREMNISGKVKLQATVEPDGDVKSTRVVGGSPLLVEAAEEALKEWKFVPGPKETTEVVEFDFKPQQ